MRFIALIFLSFILIKPILAGATVDTSLDSLSNSKRLYEELGNKSLSFEAFDLAFKGWTELKDSIDLVENVITVVDFSQASTEKRFYLIDMDKKKVIYQDYVAHGKNTGSLVAKNFSNIPNSHQSSLGFFRTAETYHGKHGLSLKLDGLEKDINNLARKRAIVIHSADYAEETFIKKYGRLGRSYGCPALPSKNYNKIIEKMKGGTLLFIYSPESDYLKKSTILN